MGAVVTDVATALTHFKTNDFVLMRCIVFSLVSVLLWMGCESSTAVPTPEVGVSTGLSTRLIQENVAGTPIVIAGSQRRNFAVAFERRFEGRILEFQVTERRFPVIMTDQYGNDWDAMGRAVSGPDQGGHLYPLNAGMGYWFVFSASYPGIEIFGEGAIPAPLHWDTLPGWDIPEDGVAQGADFDEIKALDNPAFIHYHPLSFDPVEAFYLEDDDLVVVVEINGDTKVYPHAILNWHEIINDEIGGIPVSVTYSPLTGTSRVWERGDISYGVSGVIYNNNMLAFDRFTESFWWQLEGRCVFGGRKGEQLVLRHFLETTWGAWKLVDPTPNVVSGIQEQGHPYNTFPYGDYPTNDRITYPLLFEDNRLPPKERVFGVIIDGTCSVYRMTSF